MPTREQILASWSQVGAGGYEEFCQSARLEQYRLYGPEGLNVRGGICQALCQTFVDLRMVDTDPPTTVARLKEQFFSCARRQNDINHHRLPPTLTPDGHSVPFDDWKGGVVFKSVDGRAVQR